MAGQPVCTFQDRLSTGQAAAQDVAQGGHSHAHDHAHDHATAGHSHGGSVTPDEHGHTHEHMESAGELRTRTELVASGKGERVADAPFWEYTSTQGTLQESLGGTSRGYGPHSPYGRTSRTGPER